MGMIIDPYRFVAAEPASPDPFWADVVLLTNFGEVDNATAFTDDSLVGHALSTETLGASNAVADTAITKFETCSLLLDGTEDRVTVPNNPYLYLSGDFTVEGWVYLTSAAAEDYFFSKTNNGSQEELRFYLNASSEIVLAASSDGTNVTTIVSGAHGISATTWAHIVFERSGNVWRVYVNGSMIAKATNAFTIFNGSADVDIGTYASSQGGFAGNIEGVRVTNGSARYDSDGGYTVPTAAWPRIAPEATPQPTFSNVAFLLRSPTSNGSQSFVDSSSNGYAISKTTSAGWGPRARDNRFKYGPASLDGSSASYSSGRRFWLTSNLSIGMHLGSGNFTLETWAAFASISGTQYLFGRWNTTIGNRSFVVRYTGGNLELALSADGTTETIKIQYAWSPTLNQFYHIAFDFDGTTYRLYIDGVPVATATGAVTLANPTTTTMPFAGMCRASSGSTFDYFDGWMQDIRISKEAIYATDVGFTPPTELLPTS